MVVGNEILFPLEIFHFDFIHSPSRALVENAHVPFGWMTLLVHLQNESFYFEILNVHRNSITNYRLIGRTYLIVNFGGHQ